MSDPIKGVVVSHGQLSRALIDAVECIIGSKDGLVPVSNVGCSRSTLAKRVSDATGNSPCIVFVDLPGGSCLQAAASLQRGHPSMAVVAGVNLAMLLDFTGHRDVSLEEATARAVESGGRAVRVIGG